MSSSDVPSHSDVFQADGHSTLTHTHTSARDNQQNDALLPCITESIVSLSVCQTSFLSPSVIVWTKHVQTIASMHLHTQTHTLRTELHRD